MEACTAFKKCGTISNAIVSIEYGMPWAALMLVIRRPPTPVMSASQAILFKHSSSAASK